MADEQHVSLKDDRAVSCATWSISYDIRLIPSGNDQFLSQGNSVLNAYLRHGGFIWRVDEFRRIVINVGHPHDHWNSSVLVRGPYCAVKLKNKQKKPTLKDVKLRPWKRSISLRFYYRFSNCIFLCTSDKEWYQQYVQVTLLSLTSYTKVNVIFISKYYYDLMIFIISEKDGAVMWYFQIVITLWRYL